jgi:hypothetical protein
MASGLTQPIRPYGLKVDETVAAKYNICLVIGNISHIIRTKPQRVFMLYWCNNKMLIIEVRIFAVLSTPRAMGSENIGIR